MNSNSNSNAQTPLPQGPQSNPLVRVLLLVLAVAAGAIVGYASFKLSPAHEVASAVLAGVAGLTTAKLIIDMARGR